MGAGARRGRRVGSWRQVLLDAAVVGHDGHDGVAGGLGGRRVAGAVAQLKVLLLLAEGELLRRRAGAKPLGEQPPCPTVRKPSDQAPREMKKLQFRDVCMLWNEVWHNKKKTTTVFCITEARSKLHRDLLSLQDIIKVISV